MDFETIFRHGLAFVGGFIGGLGVIAVGVVTYKAAESTYNYYYPSVQAVSNCCKDNDAFKGDFAVNFQYYFQDPASFVMVDILKLHDNILTLLVIILVFVLIMFVVCYKSAQSTLIKV